MSTCIKPSKNANSTNVLSNALPEQIVTPHRPSEDDRYPGSFFRIPGVPQPGKTTWSLTR